MIVSVNPTRMCVGCKTVKTIDNFEPSVRFNRVISSYCKELECQIKHQKRSAKIMRTEKHNVDIQEIVNWNETALYC